MRGSCPPGVSGHRGFIKVRGLLLPADCESLRVSGSHWVLDRPRGSPVSGGLGGLWGLGGLRVSGPQWVWVWVRGLGSLSGPRGVAGFGLGCPPEGPPGMRGFLGSKGYWRRGRESIG